MYPIARPHIPFRAFVALLCFWKYKGSTITAFEQQAATFFGRKHAVAFSSGRVALEALCTAMEWKQRKIAVPSYTCIVVPYAIERSGNTPVFVEPKHAEDFVPSVEELATEADIVVQTHMFGEVTGGTPPASVFVIEDACLAIGSSLHGKKAGTLGDVALFSLNQSKQLSAIGGGILLTDKKDIADRLRTGQYRTRSWMDEVRHVVRTYLYALLYRKPIYSFIKKLSFFHTTATDFSTTSCELDAKYNKAFLRAQAILGLYQLQKAHTLLAKRRKIIGWYIDRLGEIDGIRIPEYRKDTELSHMWVILEKDREPIRKALYERGINTGIANEYSCPTTPYYKERKETHASASFEGTTFVGKHIINLPFYIGMTEKHVRHICEVFQEVYEAVR